MSYNPDIGRTISRIAFGLTENLTGLLFYYLALGISIATTPGKSSSSAQKALYKADILSDQLFAAFDPSQLQNAWQNLKRKGLIETIRDKKYETKITREGIQRINQDVAIYKEKRPWNKRIYLISYDIAESPNSSRKKFHDHLIRIGCAPVQLSLYLAIYNPRGLLKNWLNENPITGDIIASDLGPDGTLGDRSLIDILSSAYDLNKLNHEYAFFLEKFSSPIQNNLPKKMQAAFLYQSILKKDPQLPFELLPDWWLGDKAYRHFNSMCKLASRSGYKLTQLKNS